MDPVPVDSDRWRFEAGEHVIEDKLGRRSLRLRSGIATLADADVRDGVVVLELSFSGARGFMGPTWRVRDKGKPGVVSSSARTSPGTRMQRSTRPRSMARSGGRSITAIATRFRSPTASTNGCRCASPSVTSGRRSFSAEPPTIAGPRRPPQARVEGAIREWSVSDAIAEASLADGALGARPWTRQQAEPTGLLDLARANAVGEGRDTALARVVLHSEREQTKRLDFGFSDRVRVYLRRRLVYSGDDRYQSRDYRFLGSIGYFDSLYLPLNAGPNELILAVTEEVGGWGVQARLDDVDGVTVEP